MPTSGVSSRKAEGEPAEDSDGDPRQEPESDALSKDLKKRGFTFVGSTIMYAFMQAVGMVNDHMTKCFRWNEIR